MDAEMTQVTKVKIRLGVDPQGSVHRVRAGS